MTQTTAPALTSLTSFSAFERMTPTSHLRSCILLVVFALACFLPGFVSLQPMDRDEPRFAQASKQMIETGDYIDIRFQDEARHKKPVEFYWAQVISVKTAAMLGVSDAQAKIWLYRIPSLIGAVLAVLATYWAALAFIPSSQAFLAGLVMAGCVLLGVEARLAKTDALLLACTTIAMGGLARAYLYRDAPMRTGMLILFWISTAAGILIKGPIILLIAGLTAIGVSLHERSARWLLRLNPAWGVLGVLALVSPWFIAIALKSHGSFFVDSVGKDMLAKVGGGQEKHGGLPGFYTLAFFATFWPVAPFAAMAAIPVWRRHNEARIRFLLAWLIPAWLLFEAVPTKLPHYVLPLYPALAILLVKIIAHEPMTLYRRGSSLVASLILMIPMACVVGLLVFVWRQDHIVPWLAMPMLLIALALAGLSFGLFIKKRPAVSFACALAASPVLSMGIYGLILPQASALKLSPRLAHAVENISCENKKVMTAGYREPSLVFLVGTDLAMGDGTEAAHFLAQKDGCRIALVTEREEQAFQDASTRLNITPTPMTRISGFNINGGRQVNVVIYKY